MPDHNDQAVTVENLKKVFYTIQGFWRQKRKPITAVDDISFSINRGELFGMVGPNGAGKTTTVKMLSTLLVPTSGKASIFGFDVSEDTAKIRPRIGFSFGGNRGLYSRLSALDNLRYFAELYYLDQAVIEKRIGEMLEIVGLTGREHDRVETYSSGMQQRLHLARAMLHDPDLIFLDEPTVGIDPVGSREIRQVVKELVNRGKTILLTTHYMFEAEELCDRIAVVNKGRIVALDSPANLKSGFSGESVIMVQDRSRNQSVQEALQNMKSLVTHFHTSEETISIQTKTPARVLNALSGFFEEGIITNIEVRNATLEDVYVQIIQEKKD